MKITIAGGNPEDQREKGAISVEPVPKSDSAIAIGEIRLGEVSETQY